MPQIIEVPGMGQVEFPDGMSDDAIAAAIKANMPAPKQEGSTLGNIAGGLARGAGSIGATLLAPVDAAARALGVQNDFIGRTDRREAMDGGLRELGADPDSLAFKGGKLAAEVAGTAGAGGAVAKGLTAVLPGAAPLAASIATGGFKTGAQLGTAANIATRAAGGAVAGGASAGLVNPEDAAVGAGIGAVVPTALKGAGDLARAAGGSSVRAAPNALAAPSQKMVTAREGASEGYVVPPVDLEPGLMTQLLSGLSGKIKTSQAASVKNQRVSDELARRALGLQAGDELTVDTLNGVRARAGQGYDTLRGAGTITADPAFLQRLAQIEAVSKGAARSFPGLADNGVGDLVSAVRQNSFDAGDAIDATKSLRDTADMAFRKGDTTLGRAAKAAATALEDQMERHLTAAGNPDAVKAFRDARQLIAKTYTVQAGLNPTTGSVSAQKLAQDLNRGKPLTGELELIGRMGQAFPKATQALKEAPGAVSPLDWVTALGTAAATGNVGALGMLGARPAVRAGLLSKPAQALAMRPPAPPNPALETAMARALGAAPVLLASPGGP